MIAELILASYSKSRRFDPFPFPADVSEPLNEHIRTEAEALDALRKRVLGEQVDLTLTKLYNVLEALRAGRALTAVQRDIHDRGLVTLIRQRATEEANGLVRWLRPAYQAPDYGAPVTQTLDLGDAAPVVADNIIAWPISLPDQVSAVQRILAAAPTPLAPHDVARAFKGKRAATVEPVLQALAEDRHCPAAGGRTLCRVTQRGERPPPLVRPRE